MKKKSTMKNSRKGKKHENGEGQLETTKKDDDRKRWMMYEEELETDDGRSRNKKKNIRVR